MDLYKDIEFYNINYLRDNFEQWTLSEDAYIDSAVAKLPTGASMYTELTDAYMNGSLEKSKYKKIIISSSDIHDIIENEQGLEYKCGNINNEEVGVEIYIETKYTLNDRTKLERVKVSLNNFKYDQFENVRSGWGKYEYIYACINWNVESCKLVIKNNTNSTITINAALLYRSQDISQIGENIVTSQMHVTEFRPCCDGMQINVQEIAGHLNYWWLDDGEGNFAGINFNNEVIAANRPYNGLLSDIS